MEEEILTGGRVTAQVVRRGEFVHRTPCKNAAFVHQVLEFLEAGGVEGVPRYRGLDQQGREVLTFLPGQVPPDLGFFTQAQCCQAVERMKAFHSCLRDFPGCPPGWTVCHNDLSPCNYVFQEGRPVGIIDWDAAAFGHPLDDLAYALWLWLDLGNEEYSYATVRQRMGVMLDAYGVAAGERPGMGERIHRQMERVAQSVFPPLADRRHQPVGPPQPDVAPGLLEQPLPGTLVTAKNRKRAAWRKASGKSGPSITWAVCWGLVYRLPAPPHTRRKQKAPGPKVRALLPR